MDGELCDSADCCRRCLKFDLGMRDRMKRLSFDFAF